MGGDFIEAIEQDESEAAVEHLVQMRCGVFLAHVGQTGRQIAEDVPGGAFADAPVGARRRGWFAGAFRLVQRGRKLAQDDAQGQGRLRTQERVNVVREAGELGLGGVGDGELVGEEKGDVLEEGGFAGAGFADEDDAILVGIEEDFEGGEFGGVVAAAAQQFGGSIGFCGGVGGRTGA